MKHSSIVFILVMLIFLSSCGQNESNQNEEADTSEDSTTVVEQTAEEEAEEKMLNMARLLKVFEMQDPSSIEELKTILGEPTTAIERIANTGDPYQSSTWEFEEGIVLWYDDAQGNGFTIESKEQTSISIFGEPVILNKSSLDDCKKAVARLQVAAKSNDSIVWKANVGRIWMYFTFDKNKILKSIKLAAFDLDYVG